MKKKQKGLTILELLVATVLGLIIISGVVRLVSRTMDTERLLSNNADINEVFTYINGRLSFVFKEALSSPCGNLDDMIENGHLRRPKVGGTIQPVPNIILENTRPNKAVVNHDDFPMLAVGIAPDVANSINFTAQEPKNNYGQPMSTLMPGIVPGSEYLIVMETSEKIIVSNNTSLKNSIKNITGSVLDDPNNALTTQNIDTSKILTRVNKTIPPAFLITNCVNADIFMPKLATQEANKVSLPNDLYFSVEYAPSETLFAPVEMYGYYISKVDHETLPRFTRVNLTAFDTSVATNTPTPEVLVSGVESINYEWGLGDARTASVQGYFSTRKIITDGVTSAHFRDNLISVRATITARGQDAYTTATDENGTIKGDGILRKEAQRIYTIRNKMSRI